jgi:hypothetical protein
VDAYVIHLRKIEWLEDTPLYRCVRCVLSVVKANTPRINLEHEADTQQNKPLIEHVANQKTAMEHSHRYHAYPTQKVAEQLEHHLDVHRQLYNHVRWDYTNSPEGDKPSEYDQNNRLPEWKRKWPVFSELHSKAAQATVARFYHNFTVLRKIIVTTHNTITGEQSAAASSRCGCHRTNSSRPLPPLTCPRKVCYCSPFILTGYSPVALQGVDPTAVSLGNLRCLWAIFPRRCYPRCYRV